MAAIPPYEESAPDNGAGAEPPEYPRSVGSLVNELMGEARALTRAEIALARAEMHDQVQSLRTGVVSMSVGGAVLGAGVLALVAAAILLLDRWWPTWIAALAVGALLAGIGLATLLFGKRKAVQEGLKPTRTMNSLGEARAFARHQAAIAARKWR